jgi:hypothetical protein
LVSRISRTVELGDKYVARRWLIGLISLAALLRFLVLADFDFGGDEFGTLRWIRLPVSEILSRYALQLTMHSYIVFMKYWTELFGVSPLALKLPSLLAGILLVPAIYVLGARLAGRPVGIAAALLTALNPLLIEQSRFARAYAILVLITVVAMILLEDALRRFRPWQLVGLVFCNLAALTLSLHAVTVLVVQGCYVVFVGLLSRGYPRKVLAGMTLALLASAGLSMLFYWAAMDDIIAMRERWSGGSAIQLSWMGEAFQTFHRPFSWLFAALALCGMIRVWRQKRSVAGLLLLWAIVPWAVFACSGSRFPAQAMPRYLLPTLPAHLLLIAAGFVALVGLLHRMVRSRGVLHLSLLMLAAGTGLSPSYRKLVGRTEGRPYCRALERILAVAAPEDRVLRAILGTEQLDLIEHIPGAADIKRLESVTKRQRAPSSGRLILLAPQLRGAEKWWSRQFQLEVIQSSGRTKEIRILTGHQGTAGGAALLEAVEHYLQGFLSAAEQRPLDPLKARHDAKLRKIFRWLARIAALQGESEQQVLYEGQVWEPAQEGSR